MKKLLLFKIIFVLTLSMISSDALLASNFEINKGLKRFRVVEVHDGDTVSIRLSKFSSTLYKTERVRLIGIDAPEIGQEPWGRRSKRHLKRLLIQSDWIVSLEFDIEKIDKYGRLLVYMWDKKGQLINEKMIEDGYAVVYTIPPNVKYAGRFLSAQKRAQSKGLGIWNRHGLKMMPEDWRRKNPLGRSDN